MQRKKNSKSFSFLCYSIKSQKNKISMGILPSTTFNFSSFSSRREGNKMDFFLTGDGQFLLLTLPQSFIKFIGSRFRVSPAFNSLPLISVLSVAAAVSSKVHPVLSHIQPPSCVSSEDRERKREQERGEEGVEKECVPARIQLLCSYWYSGHTGSFWASVARAKEECRKTDGLEWRRRCWWNIVPPSHFLFT